MNYLDKDIELCEKLGGKWSEWCKDRYRNQYFQKFSEIRDVIYPWNNRDWDYRQFVKNNYSPEKLGLSKDTSISALIKNIEILVKQMESLIANPNPDENSRAGVSDIPLSNNPNLDVIKKIRDEIEILKLDTKKNKTKIDDLYKMLVTSFVNPKKIGARDYGIIADLTQSPPNNSSFFNRKLDGKNSSSYFIQNGFCKTPDNENSCKEKNYKWLGDKCYKPKYLYIDNSPGLKIGKVKGLQGLVPSMINSISQLTPDNFMGILNGYSVSGLEIEKCSEHFSNRSNISYIFLYSILILIIIGIFCVDKK
jgi:hypothetical protein